MRWPVSIRWMIPIAVLMFALVLSGCGEADDDQSSAGVEDSGDTEEISEEEADATEEGASSGDGDEATEEPGDEATEAADGAPVDTGGTEESEGSGDESAAAVGQADWDEDIVFADYGWDSALVLNRMAQFILENGYGYETDSIPGETIPLFQGMLAGDIQVSMEIWPAQWEGWDEALAEGEVHDLGLSIDETVQGWYVPTYVIEGDEERGIEPMAPDLESVEDLPDYWELFQDPEDDSKGRFYDGPAGWEAERVNEVKFEAYGLGEYYNRFRAGSGPALATSLVRAYEQGEPWLGYYWGPTWVFGQVDLTMLEEPAYAEECWEGITTAIDEDGTTEEGCAFPIVEVHTSVIDDFYQAAPDVVAFLENVDFTMEEISEVLAAMRNNELDAQGGAEWFLREKQDKWHEWVPQQVAEDVDAALEQE